MDQGSSGAESHVKADAETDSAFLQRAASGESAAFDVIVARHQAAVDRFIRTLGGVDADDVLQETFIAAWRGAGSFRGTGSARSWLLSIARNAHRHQHRRRVDEPRAFVPLELLAQRAGWSADPAESRRTDAVLAADLLTQALAHLPPDEREVLVLRELEGFSGAEAAGVLQLTETAMKSRLHRARLHLAAAVYELDSPLPPSGGQHVGT